MRLRCSRSSCPALSDLSDFFGCAGTPSEILPSSNAWRRPRRSLQARNRTARPPMLKASLICLSAGPRNAEACVRSEQPASRSSRSTAYGSYALPGAPAIEVVGLSMRAPGTRSSPTWPAQRVIRPWRVPPAVAAPGSRACRPSAAPRCSSPRSVTRAVQVPLAARRRASVMHSQRLPDPSLFCARKTRRACGWPLWVVSRIYLPQMKCRLASRAARWARTTPETEHSSVNARAEYSFAAARSTSSSAWEARRGK